MVATDLDARMSVKALKDILNKLQTLDYVVRDKAQSLGQCKMDSALTRKLIEMGISLREIGKED